MEPFDTTKYELQRKEDNSVVRVFGNGFEEPELTQEQHQYNVDFHQQIVDNSQAQLDKLRAFEDATHLTKNLENNMEKEE